PLYELGTFWEPAWARDGKSIFCHGLHNLYQFDLDGNVLKKWELSKILADAGMGSNDRLSVSPDGKSLLIEAHDLQPTYKNWPKNWYAPQQPAIYKFDLATEKATRVTGESDFIWEPCWLTNGEFLCLIQKENEASLYRMPIDGKDPKVLIKRARLRLPSVRAPYTLVSDLTEKLSRFCQRLRDLARVLARALSIFWPPAAFAAYDWRDL